MKFSISKTEFLHGLHLIQNIVQRRTTMPILNNVLIEANKTGIDLKATDLDVSMHVKMPDAEISETGQSCVNAKKLYEAVREVTEGRLSITDENGGRFEVESGRTNYRLLALDPKEFPSFPKFDGTFGSVETAVFKEMIERTIFAVSVEEIRADINGVLLSQAEGQEFRMVGTDGHRLAVSQKSLPALQMPGSVIVPRKGLLELKKVCEETKELKLGVSPNMVYAETEALELAIRTIDGEYPKYEKVIPRALRFTFRVEQAAMLAALKRVAVLSSDRFRAVRFHIKTGWMELISSNPEMGEAREEMTITGEGPEIEVSFNSRYILDVTEILPSESTMEISLTDQESPAVVAAAGDSSYLYVVMPIRS